MIAFDQIRDEPLRDLPPRAGGRVSELEPLVQRVLRLAPDRMLPIPDGAIARRVTKIVRERGIGVRYRTAPRCTYVWLDEDLNPVRRRKSEPPIGKEAARGNRA